MKQQQRKALALAAVLALSAFQATAQSSAGTRGAQAFQDMGYRDIPSLHAALYDGRLRFERRTVAALAEGTVHSLNSYQEPRFGIK